LVAPGPSGRPAFSIPAESPQVGLASAEPYRDPAQPSEELGFSRAEDAVELTVVGEGVAPELSQQRPPGSGQVQRMHPPVFWRAPPLDQPSPLEVVERGRETRFVASARPAERGLRQAGILV